MTNNDVPFDHLRMRLKVVGPYLLFAILWILVSDWLILPEHAGFFGFDYTWLGTIKGILFVIATALLLFILLGRLLRRIETIQNHLASQYHEYRRLFDTGKDPALIVDVDTQQIIAANTAAINRIGYSEAELSGLTLADLFHRKTDEPTLMSVNPLTFLSAYSERFDQLVTRDGREIPVEPLHQEITFQGRKAGLHVMRLVTEERLAQEALKDSEERFRLLAENAQDVVYRYRLYPETALEYVSPSITKLIGYTPDELYLNHEILRQSLHPDDIEKSLAFLQEATPDRNTLEVRWISRDGHTVWVQQHVTLFRNDEGITEIIESFVRDVTEQRMASQALQKSEHRYRNLIEQASDGILVMDRQGRFIEVNGQACRMFGYTKDEFFSFDYPYLVTEDSLREIPVRLDLVQTGEIVRLERQYRRKDGSVFTAEVSTSAIDDGTIQIIVRDVTDRKEYEAGLIESKQRADEMVRLKDTFLSNMSHEIRTPLTAIIGFSDVLHQEVEGRAREFAELIHKGGRRLLDTLNSVLDLAQLRGRSLQLKVEPLDLLYEVKKVYQFYEKQARSKGLSIKLEVKESAPLEVLADRAAFDRVLNNLVSNAVKFTEEGTVTLRLSGSDGQAVIEIEDTGIGMTPEYMQHLFEEFSQESSGPSRHFQGNGLGLNITKQLVDLLKGEIEVRSEKGKGSTFTVRLPVAEDPVSFAVETERPALSVNHRASLRNILLIEDDPYTRRLVRHILGSYADSIDEAVDTAEAIQLARSGRYGHVLMDINLGTHTTGSELLHEIRKIPGYQSTRFIAMTAYALPGDREKFLAEGFTDYLSKPFVKEQLLSLFFSLNETRVP